MRIPFGQVETGAVSVGPAPAINLSDAAAASGGAALQGIGAATSAAAEIGDKMLKARDSVIGANQITDLHGKLTDYRMELDRDPDVAGREAKFQARAQELRGQAADRFNTHEGRENFDIRYNQLFRPMQLQVKQQARDEELQNFRVDLSDSLDKLATRSVFARDDGERGALQAEADKSIVDAVRTGRLSASQAHGFQKAYLGRVDGALGAELVRTNPGAAIAALGDPDKFKYLDAATRVQLRAQATARAESLGVQARAELRADASEFVKDLQTGATTGNMPAEQDFKAIIARAGPKSAIGVRLQKSWDFYGQVNADSDGKSIPELADRIRELQGRAPPAAPAPAAPAPAAASGALAPVAPDAPAPPAAGEPAAPAAAPAAPPAPPSPQDLHAARVLQTALKAKVAARDRDPAGYAATAYPTIGEALANADKAAQSNDATAQAAAPEMRRTAYEGLLEAQRREGVPDYKLALMTHDQAEGARQKFLTTTDGQARADLVDQLRGQYGDHWSRVVGQLWQGKPAPGDVQMIAALPEGANLPKTEVVEANRLTDDDAHKVLGKRVASISDAVRKVVEPMAPSMRSAPDGPSFLATYQAQIEKLARLYAVNGEANDTTAAQRAADRLFFDHWEVVDGVGGATVRVPKVQGMPVAPASAVRDMQKLVMDALPKLTLVDPGGDPRTTPAQRREMLVSSVRANGFWVTTADDKAMILYAGTGAKFPVMIAGANGRPQPIVMPFNLAAAAAAHDQAQSNDARLDLANFGANLSSSPPVDGSPSTVRLLPSWLMRGIQQTGPTPPLEGSLP